MGVGRRLGAGLGDDVDVLIALSLLPGLPVMTGLVVMRGEVEREGQQLHDEAREEHRARCLPSLHDRVHSSGSRCPSRPWFARGTV
jgi:hypothetical protein